MRLSVFVRSAVPFLQRPENQSPVTLQLLSCTGIAVVVGAAETLSILDLEAIEVLRQGLDVTLHASGMHFVIAYARPLLKQILHDPGNLRNFVIPAWGDKTNRSAKLSSLQHVTDQPHSNKHVEGRAAEEDEKH